MLLVKLVDRKCLMKFSTVEDIEEMAAKTSILLDEITKWKATEFSMEYVSANQSVVVQDDNNNAEESEVDDTSTLPSEPVVKNDR